MGYAIKQGQTAQPLVFLMVLTSDHLTGATGLTPTVKLSKNGAAGVSPSGAVSEIDATNMPGWYKVAGNATDSGTLGPLALHASAAGADPVDDRFEVVGYDPLATDVPQTGDAYAVVTDPVFGNAQLVRSKVPANSLSVGPDNTSFVNVIKWLSNPPPVPATPGVPTVALATTPPTAAQVRQEMDANSTQLAALRTGVIAAGGTVAGVTGNVVGSVGSVSTPVTVGTVTDKSGYSLASTGLDSIAATIPSGAATTFPARMMQLWQRFFGKATRSPTQIQTYAADGTTVATTQAITDDGNGNETQEAAS